MPTPPTHDTAPCPLDPERGARLRRLLADLIEAHEALLEASGAHREAIRRADTEGMLDAQRRVERVCERIAALDGVRQGLTAEIDPDRPDATLSSLAEGLPEAERAEALERAARLRELILRAHAEQRRLRAATESMLSHVRGIVQQIRQQLNHAGTYGRAGRVEAGATVVTGLDMTS